jgi:hypothetical protein
MTPRNCDRAGADRNRHPLGHPKNLVIVKRMLLEDVQGVCP